MKRFDTDALDGCWKGVLDAFFATPKGAALLSHITRRIEEGVTVYPPDPYRALRSARPSEVKVVILGQDPYHGPGQAVGMSFSIPPELRKFPPSLRNIFKELVAEFGSCPSNGDLSGWADQGVLMLNAVLTVEEGKAASHAKLGWETCTDALIARVLEESTPKVFMLWGAFAQAKEEMIRQKAAGPVLILKSNHPSPLSANRPPVPFMGCGHFAKANEWLESEGAKPVDWCPFGLV